MPTISLTISAPDLTRAVDALSVRWGYQPTIDGQPNPQTKGEFVRQKIGQWVKSEVRSHELAEAQAAVSVTEVSIT
jgi:hypothetical protein